MLVTTAMKQVNGDAVDESSNRTRNTHAFKMTIVYEAYV